MVLCEMNMKIVGIPRNGKMEAVATDVPCLTATTVVMDSCWRLPKIASTACYHLRVERKAATIAPSSETYVYEIA